MPWQFSVEIAQAAEWVRHAEAILVTAGAGMGVDSGLPDFRGTTGFWRAYPPYQKLGLEFEDLANELLFYRDAELAWGFYGHRLNLYRNTVPHDGFRILLSWCQRCAAGGFVFTSNVDGQFQRAGFPSDAVIERHGSIHYLQRLGQSDGEIWSADRIHVEIESDNMRAINLPREGDTLLRPNILMFGDGGWNSRRFLEQLEKYRSWLEKVSRTNLVILEIGAGKVIPTIRNEGERLAQAAGAKLIRVNLRDADGPPGTVSLPLSALSALQNIEAQLQAT